MAKAKRTRKASKTAAKSAARRATASRARPKKSAVKGTSFRSGAVGFTVNDISASMRWYCDVLGFLVKQRWEDKGVLRGAELAAGDATVFIGQDDWEKGRDRLKGEGVRLYFYVQARKDVDRLAEGIRSRGGSLASEPQDAWGARSFSLVDPTGYKITISSDE